MRSRRHFGPNAQRWPARLALWLATVLVALQVGFHAAMPEQMNMSQMLDTVLCGPSVSADVGMLGMPMPAAPDTPRPGVPAHAGHADTLCCLPPLAPAPQLWVPSLLPPAVRLHVAVRAMAEALHILQATARGPPLDQMATFTPG